MFFDTTCDVPGPPGARTHRHRRARPCRRRVRVARERWARARKRRAVGGRAHVLRGALGTLRRRAALPASAAALPARGPPRIDPDLPARPTSHHPSTSPRGLTTLILNNNLFETFSAHR